MGEHTTIVRTTDAKGERHNVLARHGIANSISGV